LNAIASASKIAHPSPKITPSEDRREPIRRDIAPPTSMPPFLDQVSLNDMSTSTQTFPEEIHTLVVTPSSISNRPDILQAVVEPLLPRPCDVQMLDRIACNVVSLPLNHYSQVILATDTTERLPGEMDVDYAELETGLPQILAAMRSGGRLRIGRGSTEITKEAILAGFLVEMDDYQVDHDRG
jgi:Fe-S cluster assembly protein DRE2 N-terminus